MMSNALHPITLYSTAVEAAKLDRCQEKKYDPDNIWYGFAARINMVYAEQFVLSCELLADENYWNLNNI